MSGPANVHNEDPGHSKRDIPAGAGTDGYKCKGVEIEGGKGETAFNGYQGRIAPYQIMNRSFE